MNIVIGKLGRTVNFTNDGESSLKGGDLAPAVFYKWLAKTYPQHTFYMIGKADLEKNRKVDLFDETESDIPDNIVYAYGGFTSKYEEHEFIWNKMKDIKVDCGILFSGPLGHCNVPGKGVLLDDPTKRAVVAQMFKKYSSGAIHYLNMSKTPYCLICEDPSYTPQECDGRARDIINDEKFVLAQYTETYTATRMESYDTPAVLTNRRIPFEYSGVETLYMLGRKKVDFRQFKKDILMTVIMNQAGGREKVVEEWILKHNKETIISGDWEQSFIDKYPTQIKTTRIADMKSDLFRTKYTFIHPIGDNWVTSKIWKMMEFGMLPFLSPQYDTQKHIQVNEFLRVKSPEEMWKRIEYLERNPDKYQRLLEHCYELLSDDYYNGNFMKRTIDNAIQRLTN